MIERIPIDEYCEKKILTLPSTYEGLIDYVDISSVDNITKEIVSYQTISSKDAPSRAKQLLKRGDILVSTVRPNLNAVAMIESETENLMVGSTGYCVLRCKENADARYLFNFCQSPYFVDDMSSQATGASYPAVSNSIVKSSLIPCCSVEEQRKIVDKMDAVIRLIKLRKQQLIKLDELVKSRFIEMFGDKDCPKCDVVKLSSLVKYQQGTQVDIGKQFTTCATGMTRFLRIIDYTQGNQEPRYVEKKGTYVEEDTVCIVRYGTVGFVCKGYNGILANNLFKLDITSSKINNDFLYCVLKYGTFENDIKSLSNGATMPALSFRIMDTIDILLPSVEKQKEYVAFVEQVDKSKLVIQKSLEKLETLKKALMQKYFG